MQFNPLDISCLKASGCEPHWFGLGFVQLKLNEHERIHFWHPGHGQITPEEELHDHRYGFTSLVLGGEILHEIWEWTACQDGDHEMVEVSCKPGTDAAPAPLGRGRVAAAGRHVLQAGMEYSFSPEGFHKGGTRIGAITFLTRGPVVKDTARVIRPVGQPSVCPFSAPKSSDECWSIISGLLQRLCHH